MDNNDEAIVLKKVKLQNQKYIVTLYTKTNGKETFFFQNNPKKKNQIKYLQSLYLINYNYKQSKISKLPEIKEISFNKNYTSIPFSPHKSFIIFFLNDILNKIIIEEEKNELIYNYIKNSLLIFDQQKNYNEFHLAFLIRLKKYIGINPLIKNKKNKYLDLENGVFTVENTLVKYNIKTKYSVYIYNIMLNKNYQLNNEFKTGKERSEMLNIIMQYYIIHLKDFKIPKSIQTIQEIYNDL